MVVATLIITILGLTTLYAFLPWSVIGGALQDMAPGLFDFLVGGFATTLESFGDTLATFLENTGLF